MVAGPVDAEGQPADKPPVCWGVRVGAGRCLRQRELLVRDDAPLLVGGERLPQLVQDAVLQVGLRPHVGDQ